MVWTSSGPEGVFFCPEERVREKTQILDGPGFSRALTRIAHEVLERNKGTDGVVLVGLRSRGIELARRLSRNIK